MRRIITPNDLDALNLILAHDPTMAEIIGARLEALEGALALGLNPPPPPVPEAPPPAPDPDLDAWKAKGEKATGDRVRAWLISHPGKHGPKAIRQALDIPEGEASEALQGLLRLGHVQAEGAGAGRRYWAR